MFKFTVLYLKKGGEVTLLKEARCPNKPSHRKVNAYHYSHLGGNGQCYFLSLTCQKQQEFAVFFNLQFQCCLGTNLT